MFSINGAERANLTDVEIQRYRDEAAQWQEVANACKPASAEEEHAAVCRTAARLAREDDN